MQIYFCLYFPAVYLCKRTMQNKSRLELDDYEAVSNLNFSKLKMNLTGNMLVHYKDRGAFLFWVHWITFCVSYILVLIGFHCSPS